MTELHPDDPESLPPARRRRARRLLAPMDANERAAFLAQLAHRASPSFDFFIFSLAAGALICVGFLVNSTALLVLGVVLAPFLAPVMGLSLGMVIGSVKFFFRSLAALLIGCALALALGFLSGYAARLWMPLNLSLAHLHAQLSWLDLLVLAVGAGLTAIAVANPEMNPAVPSIALAYELYLPLIVAGIGLGGDIPYLWPDGLVIFFLHLSWAVLIGALALAVMGFRPLTLFGYTLGGAVILVGVILLIGLSSAGAVVGAQIGLPTHTPSITPSPTATFTITPTPVPPSTTPSPTLTRTPTRTPTLTPTYTPTPMIAIIRAPEGGGAVIRDEPGGRNIGAVLNNTPIQLLPEKREINGVFWVRVVGPNNLQGWVLESLLATATPPPFP